MKTISLLLLVAVLLPSVAFAAKLGQSAVPEGYPPAMSAPAYENTSVQVASVPDYLGQDTVPLSRGEQQALRLSRDWTGRGPAPVLSFAGKLIYVHGASMPTILASPMQVCDIELQKGEKVHEVVVGDSARWMVETGATGSGPDETVHLFIKPVDAGLETSAVVTTDRRVYHLRLLSRRSGHTPYVGFTYSDQLKIELAEKKAAEARANQWNSTKIDGESVDLSNLNFAYTVKGKAPWKPERVYDDGRQTFIQFPKNTSTGEMPVLLVRNGSKDILVNYRVKDRAMVVDGLFNKISLILGVGSGQQEVLITREGK